MINLSSVPLNSYAWSAGSLACLMLFIRTYSRYRSTNNELSLYLSWFAASMCIGQALLAIPAFFTLNLHTIRTIYLAGELFVYASAIGQMNALWFLMLRDKVPRYVLNPVGILISLVGWLYAIPRSTISLSNHFITYKDPTFSTVIIGCLLLGLFIPVGIYFISTAPKQADFKAKLTSLTMGLVYILAAIFTGGVELIAGEVITRETAIIDLAFFSLMFLVLLWPRRNPKPARINA